MATDSSGRNAASVIEDYKRSLFWCVLAALSVRFLVIPFAHRSFLAPERQHWAFGCEVGKIAHSIVLGHGFGNLYYGGATGPTAQLAPIFPYLMAGVFALFGVYTKVSALVILGMNSLFSAFTCIPIFFIARKSFGLRVARWAMWAWAFFPYAIYFSADSMWDHALLTLLFSFAFLLALPLGESGRKWRWAAFGFLSGVSALVNPVVLGLAVVLGVWACFRLRRHGEKWLGAAATAVIVTCAAILPWLVRNYMVFHRAVFLKDDLPLEICVGNVGNALHWWNGNVHPSGNPAELAEFHSLGEQGYMAQKWVMTREFIEKHPRIFVWRSVRRFLYVWTGYWSFRKIYLSEEPFDVVDIPCRTALTIFAVIGLWGKFREDASNAIPYLLAMLVYPMVYYITHPEIAYREPIDPEILILGCCAIVAWRLRGRQKKGQTGKQEAILSFGSAL
jgi:4-amino-4-deoxy-L-arabinose transferase-like glycosyltransferase